MHIALTNYRKVLKGSVVLDGITAEFHSGEISLIQGANASGKTMLLRAISGLITPTSGDVYLAGVPLPAKMGILIGLPAFIESASAFRNLLWLAKLDNRNGREESKRLAVDALERFGVDSDDRRHMKKLSLGTRQKVALANALMGSPDIILLDEPSNGLDALSLENAVAQLEKERDRGAIIIVVAHQCPQILAIADKVYSMDNGRLYQ